MPICLGKCPVPWPNIMNNCHCRDVPEIPDDIIRLRCSPFVRLTCIPTKSFQAKRADNSCAPKDHLDFSLSACYDHHRQWWVPKAQTVMQCATYKLFPWGRTQERVCKLKCLPDDPCLSPCVASTQEQVAVNREGYRDDLSHRKCSVASPHISNTNRGYARQNYDGLFYNC